MLVLPLLARACPFAYALPHAACRMHPLASPARRLRPHAPPAALERGPFCACSRRLICGEHCWNEVLHCCPMPAHRPVRKQCSRPVRPQVFDAADLARRSVADSLLLLRGRLPTYAKEQDAGRATHMVAADAASSRRGAWPDGSERGRVGGLAREGSRRDRGAIGAPHPCSWPSYNNSPDHHCRMIYTYMLCI